MYAVCWDRKQETHYYTLNVLMLVYSITSPQVNPWFNNNFNFMEEHTSTWGLKDLCFNDLGYSRTPASTVCRPFCARALVLTGENKQTLSNLSIKLVAMITNGVMRSWVSAEVLSPSATPAGILRWIFIDPGKRDGIFPPKIEVW